MSQMKLNTANDEERSTIPRRVEYHGNKYRRLRTTHRDGNESISVPSTSKHERATVQSYGTGE